MNQSIRFNLKEEYQKCDGESQLKDLQYRWEEHHNLQLNYLEKLLKLDVFPTKVMEEIVDVTQLLINDDEENGKNYLKICESLHRIIYPFVEKHYNKLVN